MTDAALIEESIELVACLQLQRVSSRSSWWEADRHSYGAHLPWGGHGFQRGLLGKKQNEMARTGTVSSSTSGTATW